MRIDKIQQLQNQNFKKSTFKARIGYSENLEGYVKDIYNASKNNILREKVGATPELLRKTAPVKGSENISKFYNEVYEKVAAKFKEIESWGSDNDFVVLCPTFYRNGKPHAKVIYSNRNWDNDVFAPSAKAYEAKLTEPFMNIEDNVIDSLLSLDLSVLEALKARHKQRADFFEQNYGSPKNFKPLLWQDPYADMLEIDLFG